MNAWVKGGEGAHCTAHRTTAGANAGKLPGKDLVFAWLLRARVKAGAPGRKPEVRDVIELRPGPQCSMSYTVHAGVQTW